MSTETEKIVHSQFVRYHDDIGNGYLVDLIECCGAPEHVVFVRVYEAIRFSVPEGLIELEDQSGTGRTTRSKTEANVFLVGDVRWDGCSNWAVYPIDNCMLHFCRPDGADEFSWLIKSVYDIARDVMGWAEF